MMIKYDHIYIYMIINIFIVIMIGVESYLLTRSFYKIYILTITNIYAITGPPGCAVKANVQKIWRQHFVIEESMLEVECPSVTLGTVLKASGHVDRFTDLMVRDVKTEECYRADHLLGDRLEELLNDPAIKSSEKEEFEMLNARLDELKVDEMAVALKRCECVAPETKNELSEPYPFNLMFPTSIGPSGNIQGYLRPETAQGMFVNFRELLYFNGGKLPFACAQIGQSFRNEIAPRAGLLRVREFTQAEIEHFCHPTKKDHPRFSEVKEVELNLFSREAQLQAGKKEPFLMKTGEAVEKGIIANETLAYFVARTHLFLKELGVDMTRVRFRQHLRHEMAHYAQDCWDAEIFCSYGWIECVGLADRSAFDLDAHSKASKVDLQAYELYDEPIEETFFEVKMNKQILGKAFKKDQKAVIDALTSLDELSAEKIETDFAKDGETKMTIPSIGEISITKDMVLEMTKKTRKVSGRNFTPSVIEPSFGIGRIMYCLFEHTFYVREGDDENKAVFRFPPQVAPIKCTIFPLVNNEDMNNASHEIYKSLTKIGVSVKLDTTAISIGKRYCRTDELGVPFAITVDHRTIGHTTTPKDNTVTVRERDSCQQFRVNIENVAKLIADLSDQKRTWAEATKDLEEVLGAALKEDTTE
jgi:glycyl-tRNA synthetase